MNNSLKRLAIGVSPPILIDALQFLRRLGFQKGQRNEFEYVREGWQDASISKKGWNHKSIAVAQKSRWHLFLKSLEGAKPLGFLPESIQFENINLAAHNTIMTYAYVLVLASRFRSRISILDYGGGLGHYYLISKALIPDLEIDYRCRDMPVFCEHGSKLLPGVQFDHTDTCLEKLYDLTLVSGSLQYFKDWQFILDHLAKSAPIIFIARLPIVHNVPSYVFIHRPYLFGYDTEFLSWCLNRSEFLGSADRAGLRLVREFITGEKINITNAPEPCNFSSFLFSAKGKIDDG